MAKAPFIILMPGRTGSSLLVSCLSKHPNVLVEGERLVPLLEANEQMSWMSSFYSRSRFRVRAMGFKTKLKDVRDRNQLHSFIQQRQVKVIQMLREDPLRRAISTINARRLNEAHGVWNRKEGTPELGPLAVDFDELDDVLAFVEESAAEQKAFVDSLDVECLSLSYEDLLASIGEELRRVQEFLGVAVQSLQGDTVKNTPDRLELAISNYDELLQRYRGSKFEQYLQ